MIGLKRGTVKLLPHDAEWDRVASEAVCQLRRIFGDVARDIRHVGSTAIRAIKAKPIIDIAVAVDALEDVVPLIDAMAACGFHRKDVGHDKQIFFSAGDMAQDTRTHHIHVVEYESMEWRNYLNFVDYLNTHPQIAAQYQQLKETLAARYADDRATYTAGKEKFIRHTLRKAMVWSYLGKTVTVSIDRPIGFAHKKDIVYPINYGCIPGVLGGDDEELDVYLLGVCEPVEEYLAKIVAIVHREDDVEDKLVALPMGMRLTQAEIAEQIRFQEKYYDSHVELWCDGYTVREYRAAHDADPSALRHVCEENGLADGLPSDAWLTLIACEQDTPLGLICMKGDVGSTFEICAFCVSPRSRYRDVAATLLQEAMMRGRDAHEVLLCGSCASLAREVLGGARLLGTGQDGGYRIASEVRPTRKPSRQIRAMRQDEIEACVSLICRSFQSVVDEFGFTPANAPRFTAFVVDEARLIDQYNNGRPMFVCCDGEDRPIGYYSLAEKSEEQVELDQLCVAPEYRHQRIGERLLLHAIREGMVRGYQTMTAGIVEENRLLRAWYEKYGFVHVETQTFDFFPFTCGYLRKQLFSGE